MISLDLANALTNLYLGLRRDKELMAWLGLILSCWFSGWVAFAGVTGGMLASGQGVWVSVGGGLSANATVVLGVLLRSKQARTLLLTVPARVIEEYRKAPVTSIGPADVKK